VGGINKFNHIRIKLNFTFKKKKAKMRFNDNFCYVPRGQNLSMKYSSSITHNLDPTVNTVKNI